MSGLSEDEIATESGLTRREALLRGGGFALAVSGAGVLGAGWRVQQPVHDRGVREARGRRNPPLRNVIGPVRVRPPEVVGASTNGTANSPSSTH